MPKNLVYLRRPPDWEEHEKPSLPGSPSMPVHRARVRAGYAVVAVLVAITGGLGNALFSANLPTVQGQMGLTSTEAAWLTGIYVMLNMTANLLVYKFRQQYGMRLFTEIGLGVYALLTLLHLVLGSYTSLLVLRAASGLAGAACSTLGTLYILQAAPRKYVLKMLVIGVGLGQIATPLAWLLSPGLLFNSDWHNLYLFEAGLALIAFAGVVVLKLPPGVYIKSFEKLDFLTFALMVPGVGLVIAVLVQGYNHWWLDAPWLAWMLVGAIMLLSTSLYIEHHRANPILHTRWFLQGPTLRFVIGALLLRFLTAEQSYGVVGLMRTLGMTPDQMQPLFAVILVGTVVGIVASAWTFGMPHMSKQILAALALFAVAAFLDHQRTSLDRPADFFYSQFLMAMGAGIFMGPLMLTGIVQGLKYGPSHMLTCILTISMTQAMGGLLGSALLSTYQVQREQVYSVALVSQLSPADPQVAARLNLQSQAYAKVSVDPSMRSNQGALQLSQIVRREANVRAYNDVFLLTACIAMLYLLWNLLSVANLRKLAAQMRALTHMSGNEGTEAGATDGAPRTVEQSTVAVKLRTQESEQGSADSQPRLPVDMPVLEVDEEQAARMARALQSAEEVEMQVIASSDPLRDNPRIDELEEKVEQQLMKQQQRESQALEPSPASPPATAEALSPTQPPPPSPPPA